MKQIWTLIQMVFSAFGGFIGWFLGGNDGFIYALLAFVVIDYITGIMCAIADKELSSEVGFKGICKNPLYTLFQWDVNQFVKVVGINPDRRLTP